jgi:transcriptional regulator with XRE-family HTH domain
MKKHQASDFVPAKPRAKITTGEVIWMLRELKGWTQKELSSRCGINPSNLSQLEHDRLDIGERRAEQLASAFGIHPAIIMFPKYEGAEIARVG